MAIDAPRPVGSGALMWNASAVSDAPMTSAWIRWPAPRSSACAADSSTTTAAPSPNRKPSRSRSNGRDAWVGSSLRFDRAPMLPSAANAIGRRAASDPPAMTTSHSPDRMSRSASWNAMTLLAHAATWVMTGPVSPYFMLTSAAAIEPDRAGIANGLTWPGPFAASVAVPSMTCSIPPPPVLMTTAVRSRRSTDQSAKSSPAWSTASFAAAIAKWMKRLIRRAILRSIATAGSKSLTSAAIRTSKPVASNDVIGPAPDTPSVRLAQNVAASLPIGVTAPRPVTTARRAGSSLGGTRGHLSLHGLRGLYPGLVRRPSALEHGAGKPSPR